MLPDKSQPDPIARLPKGMFFRVAASEDQWGTEKYVAELRKKKLIGSKVITIKNGKSTETFIPAK